MKKKRGKVTKTKKKVVSVPKSDDSGVSSELEMHRVEKKDKVPDNKIQISINLQDVRRITKSDNLSCKDDSKGVTLGMEGSSSAPLLDGSDKSRFSFDDDVQSCLDYEPYEEEPEDYVDSPESTYQPEAAELLQDSFDRNNTLTDYNNVEPIENFYLGYDNGINIAQNSKNDSSNISYVDIIEQSTSCDKRSSNNDCPNGDALQGNFEQDTLDEHSGGNSSNYWELVKDQNVVNISKEDEYVQHDEGDDGFEGSNPRCDNAENCAAVFKNAEVNFSGPLNITITRPVINNIQYLKSNPETCVTNEKTICNGTRDYTKLSSNDVVSPSSFYHPVTNNLRITSHDFHSESSNQKIKWPKHELDLKVIKITSGDDIFGYNMKDDFNYYNILGSFSCSQSEASCMLDLDVVGKTSEKEPVIDRTLNYNSSSGGSFDRISDEYKNSSTTNSYYSQNILVSPSQMERSDTSVKTFENSDQNSLTNSSKFEIWKNSSSGFAEGVFRHPLKRPPTRPQKKSVDIQEPITSYEDDALSILGASTILEVGSNMSEASESDTVMQESHKEEFVNRWLMVTSETNVDQILESLCESHFTSNCDIARCDKSHFVDEKRIKQLSPTKLTELYELAKGKIFWFTHLFDVFVDCLKTSSENGRLCLVDMINDVFVLFRGTFIDKTSYISKIVCALQSTGLSFKESIEYIILRYGTSQISICDILLFIIAKESHLDDHWCLVQKILCCRREKLDHNVVINLLHSSLAIYPPNIDMCKKIYYEIFEKNLVDLDKIPHFLWAPIRMAMKSSRTFESPTFHSEINDSNIINNSLLDQNSTIPSACSGSDDENRFRIENSIPVFDPAQFQVSGSVSSGTCSEGLSEFNKSLWRMKQNQNKIYCRGDRNGDMKHIHPDNSQVTEYLFNKPMNSNEISLTHSQNEFSPNNETVISDNTRTPVYNNNIRNINDVQSNGLGICNSEDNYLCNYSINSDQNVFKTPCDKILKKRINSTNLRNIKHKLNRESQLERKTSTKIVYKNDVLNKINKSLNLYRRSETPESSIAHPDFQPVISSRYKCNVSLHNLYPDVQVNATEITKNELLQLREALQEENGSKFLSILEAYRNAFTIENFILNTLILIKTPTNTLDIFKKFMSLLNSIELVDDKCLKNSHVKMVVEVLAMNLIYFLEKKGEWGLCRNILLRIKMKNWHSLFTSKIFFCTSHLMSHMCRYIYISEILARAGDFHWVNEIFQLNTLCLLGPMSEWPYQNVPSDLVLRNEVLQLFFDEGFIVNIVAVNDLLNHINFVNGGCIEGFDVWKLFDDKLSVLLDTGEEHRSILQYLSPHIANYGRYMAKNVLQGYMIFIKDCIAEEESFKLFRICSEKGVYHKYTGNERVIVLRTKMCDFEIRSILACFFENILKRNIRPHDFCIELKLPEPDQPGSPQLLKDRLNRSIYDVYASVMSILKLKYNIIVEQTIESTILVTDRMQHLLPFKV